MTRAWLVVALLLAACADPTAPTVRCDGELEVTITVTRFGQDTTVACVFPPPPPDPPGDDCDDDHGLHHGRHHRHGHHDHPEAP